MEPSLIDFIDTIRCAAAQGHALQIRGGGSKHFLSHTRPADPLEPCLDTRTHAGIVAYEPTELVVTVKAGTPLRDLEAALATEGQCLPFEPPHLGDRATVGGMVAAGLSGPARASVGAVRDYVLGVQMLNGRGEPLSFGGQVMKNVAGYDVSRVLAGSMGTLGLITEVSLKVLPVAPAEATLRFEMTQADALSALHRWGGQPLPLNASCWVEDEGHALLFVRLRGAVAAVDAACARMGGWRMDPVQAASDWVACREQVLPFFQTHDPDASLWRLSLPQTAPVLALEGVSASSPPLVEWHGAQRWLWAGAAHALHIRAAAQAVGGHATLFRPAQDRDRDHGVFTPLSPPLAGIHRRLKTEFDPAGVFNPGRLCADF
jgi:glycolate oxidase FAD binding subunit